MSRAGALMVAALLATGLAPAWAQPVSPPPAPAPAPAPAVEAGSKVSIEYTLRDDAGMVLDSNQGRSPLTYVQGREEIVPGLERALSGMHAGEEKQVTVPPADAYGDVDPAAVAEVPKDLVPAEARVAGTELMARGPQGASRLVRVKEVREGTVLLDLNHPLAGKTLFFSIKVIGVEPPGKE
jgi:FKBP-type peptidyl-prolyl cis-trans isomerase SlyD